MSNSFPKKDSIFSASSFGDSMTSVYAIFKTSIPKAIKQTPSSHCTVNSIKGCNIHFGIPFFPFSTSENTFRVTQSPIKSTLLSMWGRIYAEVNVPQTDLIHWGAWFEWWNRSNYSLTANVRRLYFFPMAYNGSRLCFCADSWIRQFSAWRMMRFYKPTFYIAF